MKIFQTRLHKTTLLLSVIFTFLSPLTADARKLSGSTGAFAKAAKPPRPTSPPKPPVTKPAPKPPTGGKGDAATPPKATVVAPSASRGAGHVSGAAVGATVKPGNSLNPDTARDVIASIAPHAQANQKPIVGKPLDEAGAHLGSNYRTVKPGELYVDKKTGKMRRVDQDNSSNYDEKYGADGSKNLENGRTRYYGEVQPASKAGEMAGRRYVHEHDPSTGATRGWHETVDHSGKVRQVRPEMNDGSKKHYRFDNEGNYIGSW